MGLRTNLAIIVAGAAVLGASAGCGAMDNGDKNANPVAQQTPSSSAEPSSTPSDSSSAAPSNSEAPSSGRAKPGTASAPDGSCKAADLALSLGAKHGAAGTEYQALVFKNKSQRACTLTGFPGVSYVAGSGGKQVGKAAERTGGTSGAVSLTPGKTATADVGFTRIGNYDQNECKPTDVRGLRVYAPGDRAAMFVATQGLQGCAGSVPGAQLKVTSVHQ